ncbi:hypothetical protein [Paenibacillus macerans]|uniref:hypothetical protein n=1 Tax=Paenibacillus macerans TaxID=44252 RepID=UPI003D31D77D
MAEWPWVRPILPAELEEALRAGRKLLTVHVTLFPECKQKLARFRLIDVKLRAFEQVLGHMPDLGTAQEEPVRRLHIDAVTWLLAIDGEPEHLRSWIQLMLDVDKVEITEMYA